MNQAALNPSVIRFCGIFARIAASFATAVGLLSLLGWTLGVELLKGTFLRGVGMKANTAVCLVFVGISLWTLLPDTHRPRTRTITGRSLAFLAALIGFLTFAEHLTGRDLGIDQLLFSEPPGAVATTSPGRMGPPASTSFVLLGTALLLLDFRTRRHAIAPSQWLALLVNLITLVPLIGYAYGFYPLYGISNFTGIAGNTAAALAILALGVLAARPHAQPTAVVCADDLGGVMARRLLAPALLIPFTFGWIRTVGERAGWFDTAFGRTSLVLSLIVAFVALVWWSARALSLVSRQRARAQYDLRASDERYRSFIRLSSEGIWRFELEEPVPTDLPEDQQIALLFRHAYLAECNDAMARMYGYNSAADLTGRRLTAFHDPSDPGALEFLRAFIRNGYRLQDAESDEPDRDGNRRTFLNSFVGTVEHGRLLRAWGTQRDVTDRRRAELEREQLLSREQAARAEAERANRSKDEFLATLSHELRTPLTPVLLTVSLLESRPDLPDDLRADVSTIRRNVELESRLISDLLDLTRVAHGKLTLDPRDVDVHLLIRSAVDICQRDASAKLTLDLAASRPTVHGDATRLQQIIWNLVNNAIKFTGPDGAITVRSSDLPDNRVRIEVTDTGEGIDPAVLPRLFNAFEQGTVRASRQQAGLGLGLAISKKLAEAHGGTISASSPGRGKGSTFTVDLPSVPSQSESRNWQRGTPPPPIPQSEIQNPQSLAVLVVEDHEPTLKVMSRLLSSLGHRVTGATTVASATAAASHGRFDLIISDLGLPDGSGLDIMRHVRDRYAGRAIALTGYGMDSDIAASKNAGFAQHLTKPVDLHQLQAAIDRLGTSARG